VVNHQPLASPITCLGDGHDGVWNIIDEIAPNGERREILDWYHLMENKVGGSLKRLRQAETLLWQGQVEAKALFADCTTKQAQNFINYLEHCDRIVNYQYYQAEQICSIGSGAVESAKLTAAPKSQALSGTRRMFLKCWLTVVLI